MSDIENNITDYDALKREYHLSKMSSLAKIFYLTLLSFNVLNILTLSGYKLEINHSNGFNRWHVIVFVANILNILFFVLAIYNRYVNNKTMSRLQNTKNHLIFYFMTVPMLVIGSIYCILLYENIVTECSQKGRYHCSTILYITILLHIGGIIIIIRDVEGIDWNQPDERTPGQKLAHIFTVNVAILETIFLFLYQICDKNVAVYIVNVYRYIPKLRTNSTSYTTYDALSKFGWLLNSSLITLFVISLVCLLTYPNATNTNLTRTRSIMTISTVGRKPIIMTATIATLTLLTIPVIFTLNIREQSQAISMSFNMLAFLGITTHVVGIVACRWQLSEVRRWQKLANVNVSDNFADQSFVWMGFMGQLLNAFSTIYYSVNMLLSQYNDRHGLYTSMYVMCIIYHVVGTIQAFNQTVLVEISLDRRWARSEREDSYANRYCPVLLLVGVNISSFVHCLYKAYFSQEKVLPTLTANIVYAYSSTLGDIFGITQRLHAVLFFIQMFLAI